MVDLLVDGNSLYARSWYAIMSKPDGSPQDAIRASLCTVLSLLNVNNDKLGDKIDRILFAWDGLNKRDKGRSQKPAQYHPTLNMLKDYLSFLLNPTHACSATWEADDVVATAVHNSDADTIYVVSGDKDLQQLAEEHVHYYCLNHKSLLSLRAIRDRWGVKHPNQVCLALAIIGDKADNIVGIRGWGPKKTKQLFEAVPVAANLEEALQVIETQIPNSLLNGFYADLDLTLLYNSIPGISPAAPIKMAPIPAVTELHLPNFMEYYKPVFRLYHGRTDAAGDEEDTPVEKTDQEY
jgi:DNA polymerase-1